MFENEKLAYENGECATVSVADWILYDLIKLLYFIPVVGFIAAIALYIVIGANKKGTPSIQNRVITDFIWIGVGLVLTIVFVVLLLTQVVNLQALLAAVGLRQA